jgi:hypothetical protein
VQKCEYMWFIKYESECEYMWICSEISFYFAIVVNFILVNEILIEYCCRSLASSLGLLVPCNDTKKRRAGIS